MSLEAVRIGIVGLGNIGTQHAKLLASGAIDNAELAASSDDADAVLVATPTMSHPEIGSQALGQGRHLLMEKPLAMSKLQAQALLAAAPPELRFAVMLNQRFHPAYARIKQVLDDGRLGALRRFAWQMTTWYRPDVYFRVSRWRGTWPGEGGGLLINQCIHNLDVLQWLLGMPRQVYAIAGFGKCHKIDVEDEVTATLVYDGGVTGTVTASSGEAPGINQLDLVGDLGTLRFDGETIRLLEADSSVAAHCAQTLDMFGMPAFADHEIGIGEAGNQHAVVIQNFVDAILHGEALATPAAAGVASIELANAMLLSAWRGQAVPLPLDAREYEAALQQRIDASSLREPEALDARIDMEKSYR